MPMTLERDGCAIIPFPGALAAAMREHIHADIARRIQPGPIRDVIELLSDYEFVQAFAKPQRLFPMGIGTAACAWAGALAPMLGGAKAGINYISETEFSAAPALARYAFDVFWRCVRAHKPDVARPHSDFQFWEIAKGTPGEARVPFDYDERWKIWIPLEGCDAQNSLQVVPGSHREPVPSETLDTPNGRKPSIPDGWIAANAARFVCPLPAFSDVCVLFHDRLVHRGPENPSHNLRISAELTILLKH